MIYLDNNATTFLIPAVRDRIRSLIAAPLGNPSSPHRLGSEARALIEKARDQVAAALGARSECVLFVASGSEANAMAVAAAQTRGDRDEIIVSAVEHSSVAANAGLLGRRGYVVREAPVEASGRIDLDRLSAMVNDRTSGWPVRSASTSASRRPDSQVPSTRRACTWKNSGSAKALPRACLATRRTSRIKTCGCSRCSPASRVTYPVRLSTPGVPMPIGGTGYR